MKHDIHDIGKDISKSILSICVLYIDSITNWEVCLIHVIYSTCNLYNHEFQLYNTINYGLLRCRYWACAVPTVWFDCYFFLSQHDWEVICTLWHFMFSKPHDPAWIFERSGFDFTQLSIDRILALKKQSLYLLKLIFYSRVDIKRLECLILYSEC